MGMQALEATGRARVGLAEALTGKGEYVAAMAEAGESRNVAVAVGADDLLWRALVSLSRAQRKLKRPDDAIGSMPHGQDLDAVVEKAQTFIDNGFDHVFFHQIGPDQQPFFDAHPGREQGDGS